MRINMSFLVKQGVLAIIGTAIVTVKWGILAAVLLQHINAVEAAQDPRPNVLFIAIDDLNDWVEPLGGHPLARTPNMNRLAAQGVTFTNANCQAPLCNPSRTSILTGLRPSTTGIYALQPWFRTVPEFADWVTLPQYFMKNGYEVVTTGKIYHDAYPPQDRRDDGEEFTTWGLHGGFLPRPEKRIATPYTRIPLVDWGVYPDKDENTFDYDVVSYAVERLQEGRRDKPLFLNVGIRHPHLPLYAPQCVFDPFPGDDSVLPPVLGNDRDDLPEFAWRMHWKLPEPRLQWLIEHDEWKPHARAYLASVYFADAMVGRLLDALEESNLADNTIIVMWSDHGYHLGEKQISGKNTLWERSARVPLIIAGPGYEGGVKSHRPVELLDMYPTLVEACNLPEKEGLDGESLVSLLLDPDAPRMRPAIITHGPGNHAVRSERYRYIQYANGEEELYDLYDDPNEWTNLVFNPV